MVVPFLPFLGLTVSALIKEVAAHYTSKMAKKKIAKSFLIERLDQKIEKKFGKQFLQNKLNNDNLEEVRNIIHEELSAYSSKKEDIDQIIVNSLHNLSDEHQQILTKLDNVENLLQKISIPLAYSITKESEEEIPAELLTGLLEGSLKGQKSSQKVLNELKEEKKVSSTVINTLKEFEFVNRVSLVGETEISLLVKKFTNTPKEINNLSTLMEISDLLVGGPNEELENLLSEFVFKMINEGVDNSVIEDSVISFCFLVHRLGKLGLLSESDRLLLGSFLRKNLSNIEDPTRMLESYYLLSVLGMAGDISTSFIKEILEQHQKQGIGTTKEMIGQLRVDGRMVRFLKRLGLKKSKPETSIRTISQLIRKLDKRKFVRSTQLLKYQLERLTTEMNLMIIHFEKKEKTQVDITELIELIQSLLEILNRPRILKLDLETRKRVIELMDAVYYLYDLLAIRNSWSLLNQFQLDVSSMYSPTLGEYKRVTTDEASFNRSLAKFSQKRLKRIAKELPSPPKQKARKKMKE